jgi:hypothetical protein
MPRIIVVAERSDTTDDRVVLEERLVRAHLESDHASAQLVERLGWAIVDADELERTQPADARPGSSPYTPPRA